MLFDNKELILLKRAREINDILNNDYIVICKDDGYFVVSHFIQLFKDK